MICVEFDSQFIEVASLNVDEGGVYYMSPAYRCPGCGRDSETGQYCNKCRSKGRDPDGPRRR